MKPFSDKHKAILFIVLAVSFFSYTVVLYVSPPVDRPLEHATAVLDGKALWQKYNCNACHQLYGLGGYLGPDLTNVYEKGPDYIKGFLVTGTNVMPDFHLNNEEIEHLISYFKYLNTTGSADPRSFKIYYDGRIEQ
ncbi:MAG: cytochrome c [Ferruginibacter sp.]|nr:cytochrome c [Ferruginibacter sp.]